MSGDDDDDVYTHEKPNRREPLAAPWTLQRYISDISDPFSRRLEVILGFGRQTPCREEHSCSFLKIILHHWLFHFASA